MAELTRQDGAAELGHGALKVEWAVAASPARGETRSGDAYVVREDQNGVLIVVLDAIGHGSEAADVVTPAVAAIEAVSGASPSETISACHRALRWTRGIVATAASLSAGGQLKWTGVGNVAGVVLRPRYGRLVEHASVRPRPGIIGSDLPRLQETSVPLRPADILLIATDGVKQDFAAGVDPAADLATQVAGLFRQYRVPTDDGLLLAATWRPRSR